MGWRLLVQEGADKGRSFPLSETAPTLIGKSHKDTNICLNDLYVARVHCQLHVEDSQVVVTDLQSGQGTSVNGTKVIRQVLRAGDVVRLGNTHMVLQPADQPLPRGEEGADIGLAADGEAEGFEVVEDASPDRLDEVAELSGRTWGHYEIGPVLGRGCHSVTFAAKDLKTQRTVTLKVFSPLLPADQKEMRQYVEVLRKIMLVKHPGLAVLYGLGKTGASCWIAREHVEGEDLGAVIERISSGGRVNWKNGFRVAVQVARALEFLHKQSLLHGNVTPRNILVRTADKQLKLIDARVAAALQGTALYKVAWEARLAYDLPYLAPEQLEPTAFVDHLAEIYALGAVVFARLTGRPPFFGSNPEQTRARICHATFVPARKHQPTIPAGFDRVVAKMLARRQEDRYQSLTEVLVDLDAVVTEEGLGSIDDV
jgi:hypothetical protein